MSIIIFFAPVRILLYECEKLHHAKNPIMLNLDVMQNRKRKSDKPRTTPWVLGLLVFGLFAFLIILQSSNIWKSFTIETAEDSLTLYALLSLNFIALIIFSFIFIRNLLKLFRERRARILGSKIKTRLLIYFFGISFLPILAMAVFSYLYMNRALERWFQQIPDSVISETRKMQNDAVLERSQKLNETARMLAAAETNQNLTNDNLNRLLETGNLSHIEIISPAGEVLAQSERKLEREQKEELDRTLDFIRQGKSDAPELRDSKGFDVAVADFADGRKLVIVPQIMPDSKLDQTVENSFAEFSKLNAQKTRIRQIGLSTLGLLTFLLIFTSSWTALYIARGLTVPIKALAEGADEIARGNFANRVDVLAEDELGLLVSSFNQMSAKLEENSAELSERRRYIETVLQSLSTGVISFNADNKLTTINRAAVQMLKLENADFQNFSLSQLVSEENRVILEKIINRAKRGGASREQTILAREYADGAGGGGGAETSEGLPVALTATALPNAGGTVLVIEDLSELITAQRASAWAEVARRMAHEIKNPLTPIQLSAERIAKRFAQSQNPKSKVQSFLEVFKSKSDSETSIIEDPNAKVIKDGTETILREVNSLKSMVDEFSRFARLPNVKLESGNLNALIEKSAMLYDDRFENLKIETNLAKDLPNAMIDEEQLKRVFVNLIDNAIEASDELQDDTRISITTRHDAARDLSVAEVSDNGRGIAPPALQKLFQPYFSTKGRGTGLGLAIVQRIIIEHGGKIKVIAGVPKGAKFIVELPLAS
ncbi:MAG: ATP-binding protein [Pyrinomonadaceae bacterium]